MTGDPSSKLRVRSTTGNQSPTDVERVALGIRDEFQIGPAAVAPAHYGPRDRVPRDRESWIPPR